MLGMVEGNGHPYSWSAIINGEYNREKMALCPYPTIPDYLGKQPPGTLGIPGARVTHVWTDDPADAVKVAEASCVGEVAARPEDVIGKVDAVIIATDKGYEHVDRARPFVEAGLPVFLDKPMTDNEPDLVTICRWVDGGARILSSSCMRYAKEIEPYHRRTFELGDIRLATMTMAKKWETYGIHALEAIYPIFGPGFLSVRNTGSFDQNIVHIKHACGADIVVAVEKDMLGASGLIQLCGTAGYVALRFQDTFYSFKKQLESFIGYLRTGRRPFPFAETVELVKLVIAGIRSRDEGGREVLLDEIMK
jgi:predicted dehydrogenase